MENRRYVAEVIAVPPFHMKYLRRGHAIQFRCHDPEALRMRVDVMSRMRGVDSFAKLWARRTTIDLPDGTRCDLLALPDLVQSKKTQRDQDRPMIRRLVEAHYFQNRAKPNPAQARFWFQEMRTPGLLVELARGYPVRCRQSLRSRPLLTYAAQGRDDDLERALHAEESAERKRDQDYWVPLRAELERLRHARP